MRKESCVFSALTMPMVRWYLASSALIMPMKFLRIHERYNRCRRMREEAKQITTNSLETQKKTPSLLSCSVFVPPFLPRRKEPQIRFVLL